MNSCLLSFYRRFPRANELQPWLWMAWSTWLMTGGQPLLPPPRTPQRAHSTAGKEAAKEGHQNLLDKHGDQGQSQTSKGRLPWEPTSAPDGKGSPHLPFSEGAGREQSRGRKVSTQSFPTRLDKVVGSQDDPPFVGNTYIKHADWGRNRPPRSLVFTTRQWHWGGETRLREGQSPEALGKGLKNLSRWEKSLHISVGVFHSQGHSIVFYNTAFNPTCGYQSYILLKWAEILFSIC